MGVITGRERSAKHAQRAQQQQAHWIMLGSGRVSE